MLIVAPLRSPTEEISFSASVTSVIVSGYSVATPRRFSIALSWKASMPVPFFANEAMSFWISAKSADPSARLPTFSTLAPVDWTFSEKSVFASTIVLTSFESGK